MICDECKTRRGSVSPETKGAYERAALLQQKTIKWLIIGWVLTVVLLVATNAAWLWYESQFETVSTIEQTISAEQSGYAANGREIY